MKNTNKSQIHQVQKLLHETNDPHQLKDGIRTLINIVENFETEKQQMINDKDKQTYDKLLNYKELEEKYLNVDSQFRRMN